jgi:hypothetical protein
MAFPGSSEVLVTGFKLCGTISYLSAPESIGTGNYCGGVRAVTIVTDFTWFAECGLSFILIVPCHAHNSILNK